MIIVIATTTLLALIIWPMYRDQLTRAKPQDSFSSADRAIAALQWQNLTLAAPRQLELGSTGTVEVALGGGKAFEQLASLLETEGAKVKLRVLVSNRMEASLTGPTFEIVAVTPVAQLVSTKQPTVWRWTIRAKSFGQSSLHFSLNALFTVDGKDTQKSIRTLDHVITVKVTTAGGAWAFVEVYWAYITVALSAVVLPFGVYLFRRWFPKPT